VASHWSRDASCFLIKVGRTKLLDDDDNVRTARPWTHLDDCPQAAVFDVPHLMAITMLTPEQQKRATDKLIQWIEIDKRIVSDDDICDIGLQCLAKSIYGDEDS
jgi:hypothetical protein